MISKVQKLIYLPVITIIIGIVLNMPEFFKGSPATSKNLIVTVLYIAIWLMVLSLASRHKERKILKYYSMFWLFTLFFALLSVYINTVHFVANWAIPFVGLLLPQWYGIEIFAENLLITNITISSVSLIMFIATLISLKRPQIA